ncbi:ribbon-helix-helix domain-containing protein [Cellulomonas sp. NPDC058312]|uniref:ribbon-helix-helix domain-containing protein n=1 Tax=Cellulomonas sp. NPDC058312 TaxID=3346441 RepID=UPI0036E780F3
MSEEPTVHGTINGVPIDDAQVQAWADEAEAGYDLPITRRRGRPAAGRGPGRPVTVRLDDTLLAALTERAKEEGLSSQSDAIRAAVRSWTRTA